MSFRMPSDGGGRFGTRIAGIFSQCPGGGTAADIHMAIILGHMVKNTLRIIIVMLAIFPSTGSTGQDALLIGQWISSATVPDPNGGVSKFSFIAQFQPNGQLVLRTGYADGKVSGEQRLLIAYRIKSGASFSTKVLDYEPKQDCSTGICFALPLRWAPIGATGDCSYQFSDQNHVTIQCDTRVDYERLSN
jgi:hypothetical protein